MNGCADGALEADDGLHAVPAWHNWDNSQLERWLTDHKVPNPGELIVLHPARLLLRAISGELHGKAHLFNS